jgi:shikimate kinase
MIVYMLGFMGSGKSTAGKKLASSLSWKYVDLDKEIERRSGRSIHEIFEIEKEDYFRKLEAEVLRDLNFPENTIISCGGGTPCFNSNMDFMLGNGLTVYLKMEPEQLKNRLVNSKSVRPLISKVEPENLVDFIKNSLQVREKWYSQAEIIADGHNLDVTSLAETVLKKVNH